MQLVGATAAYVRRQFLVDNLINGVVAGLIASAILCGAYAYLASVDAVLAPLADWTSVGIVCCGLVVVGMLICFIAAFFATNRYLRQSFDRLYN